MPTTLFMEPIYPNRGLPKPELDVLVSICDGIEEVWVTGGRTTILLCGEIVTGQVRGFSCRAAPGMVVEIGCGQAPGAGCEIRYPSLCIFMEEEDGRISPQQYCVRRNGGWVIED